HSSTKLTLLSATREIETRAVVRRKELVAEGVVALTLRPVADEPFPSWEPGAHVDLDLDGAPARQYSLCGDPADRWTIRLGVLRDDNGRGSSVFVHDRLQEGDT